MSTEYNGWTNYETWCVALWLDNEQGTHDEALDMARRQLALPSAYAECHLADDLEEMHANARPELQGVYADLMTAALGSVNWREIAQRYIDQVNEERAA